jgi:DNA-binding NarL/FixJ family response regulator
MTRENPLANKRLSPRELELVKQIAQGKLNKEIAAPMNIREGSARMYTQRAMEKLNCHSRVLLAVRYVTTGKLYSSPE